ncbi:MAG: signal peptidase I [Acidobacteriaceae bacterium]
MSTTLPTPPTPAVAQAAPGKNGPGRGYLWLSAVQALIKIVVVALFVITFVVQAFRIPSASMKNTLLVGDYLLVDKEHFGSSPLFSKLLPYDTIKRDDIIVFRFPVDPQQHFVKRVIGIPGDRIRLVHSTVFVNGKRLDEPYAIHESSRYDSYNNDFPDGRYVRPNVEANWYVEMHKLIDERGELIVPEGYYFVLGDNRDDSEDSRYWGFVPRENVLGRPLVIYFSINQDEAQGALRRWSDLMEHFPESVRWGRCLHLVF